MIERGAVLLHRLEPGRLVEVEFVVGGKGYVTRIDGDGMKVKGARRRSPVALSRLAAAYQVYRPCRWELDCLVQATVALSHSSGGIDACVGHAAAHLEWAAGDQRGYEPEPDCWCTDTDEANGTTQSYCPVHGTPQERGTNLIGLPASAGAAGAGGVPVG